MVPWMYGVVVKQFANDFQPKLYHSWKSPANHLIRDQTSVTDDNQNIALFLTRYSML